MMTLGDRENGTSSRQRIVHGVFLERDGDAEGVER